MNTKKYQSLDLTGTVIGLVIVVMISGIGAYILSQIATTVDSIVNKTGVEGLNVSRIMYYGVDSEKTLTQFLPVFAIGSVAIILITLFVRTRLGTPGV